MYENGGRWPERPEEGVGHPVAGETCGCKLPEVSAENRTQTLFKSKHFQIWAISLVPNKQSLNEPNVQRGDAACRDFSSDPGDHTHKPVYAHSPFQWVSQHNAPLNELILAHISSGKSFCYHVLYYIKPWQL